MKVLNRLKKRDTLLSDFLLEIGLSIDYYDYWVLEHKGFIEVTPSTKEINAAIKTTTGKLELEPLLSWLKSPQRLAHVSKKSVFPPKSGGNHDHQK